MQGTASAIETRRRYDWLEILTELGLVERELLLRNGTPPDFRSLVGHQFAGANTLWATKLLGIRKFVKGFYEGPPRANQGPEPFIQGYNVNVRQNADADEHILLPSAEAPKRHSFYRVHSVDPSARDSFYPNALLLDYSLGGNGIFGAPLRDYLVQVYPDDPDLLLGKAYGALGPLRIPMGFFVLRRMETTSYSGGR